MMKQNRVTSFVIAFLVLNIFSSCKYEEGPWISFIRAEKRVMGTYYITKYEVAGIDSTTYQQNLICGNPLKFDKDEDGKYLNLTQPAGGSSCIVRGYWNLTDHNCKITLRSGLRIFGMPKDAVGDLHEATYDILELRDDKMKFSGTYNNQTHIIELSE